MVAAVDAVDSLAGVGIGWRPELAWFIEQAPNLGFVEIIAESVDPRHIPQPIQKLRQRGIAVIPHGISLSLGGAEALDARRLDRLARLAEALDAPCVSEHLAFVRAGAVESGHLLPVQRTEVALEVVVENIRCAEQALPVPLAIENISTLVEWPNNEMDEPEFLRRVLSETNAWLLVDLENVHANATNHHWAPNAFLDALPLDRIAYVHVAGGGHEGGHYHDTHARPVSTESLALVEELCARRGPSPVLLERDDGFGSAVEMAAELTRIENAIARGSRRLEHAYVECGA